MLVLVTGATGLLGNNIVRGLAARGDRVRVLIRDNSDPRPLAGLQLERVVGDVTQPDAVREAAWGVQAVIHAAGDVHVGWSRAKRQHAVNVVGSENVARAALAAGARMVHVSTVNALGLASRDRWADESWAKPQPLAAPYVATKREADRRVRELIHDGLDGVIVYPSFMLGRWDWKPSSGRMLRDVAKHQPLVAPRGGCSLASADCVAEAIRTAMDRAPSGRDYVLAGVNLSYLDLWTLFAKVAGRRKPWIRLGPILARIIGLAGDVLGRWGEEPDWNSVTLGMGGQRHYFSSERAVRELGYRIPPAEQIVRQAWEWLQSPRPNTEGDWRRRAG